MSEEQEQPVPVWHSIVGADHEPVQVNDVTHLGEDVLVASGWIAASGGGFRQQPDSLPRRRRKLFIQLWTKESGRAIKYMQSAEIGECFMVGTGGTLIPIDKPAAKSTE